MTQNELITIWLAISKYSGYDKRSAFIFETQIIDGVKKRIWYRNIKFYERFYIECIASDVVMYWFNNKNKSALKHKEFFLQDCIKYNDKLKKECKKYSSLLNRMKSEVSKLYRKNMDSSSE